MGRRGPKHGGGGGPLILGPTAVNSPPVPAMEKHPPFQGPSPGVVSAACQYIQEQQLRRMQRENGCDPAREDSYRLQGVALIDSVREALQLPVKTFATACTYYHKFRLNFRDAEYNFQDAALSALFVACKVEDTIKKSRDILCAAHNLRTTDKPTTPDDKIFDRPSAIIVGLDRLILQTVGFDFRVRYPQKLLVKIVRQLIPPQDAKDFLATAYPMSIDLYKTFAPIKQTTFTMVMSIIELTALITKKHVEAVSTMLDPSAFHTSRNCIVETLLDLLDLYTHFPKSTKIGSRFDLDSFVSIKIRINQQIDEGALSRVESWCEKCSLEDSESHLKTPASATTIAAAAESPATTIATGSWTAGGGTGGNTMKANLKRHEGTMRFVFEADKMLREQAQVAEYFKEEYEEVEEEIEEPIALEAATTAHSRYSHAHGSHGSHGGQGGRHPSRRDRGGHSDSGWNPYHRNRNQDHRLKQRKGGAGGGGASGTGGGFY